MKLISQIGLLLNTVAIASCSISKKKDVPNLLIVFPDQMRASAMGFMNEDPVITPNLNSFSEESVVFTNVIANAPVCSPARAMLMSGKYPFENGVAGNCYDSEYILDNQFELKEDEVCWSDILKEKGYDLGYIGKWHLDKPYSPYIDCLNNKYENKWNEWCPPNRRHGFDYWYAYGTYDYHMKPMYWDTDAKRDEFHYIDQWGPIHEADMAIKYLNNKNGQYRDPSKPFALVVAMNPPHDDGEGKYEEVPLQYVDLYKDKTYKDLAVRPNAKINDSTWSPIAIEHIKNYFAMVSGVDDQFGRILETLKKQGLYNNTIVVFMSDHGDCLGSHNRIGKTIHYEESVNIPFIIRWPEELQPRKDEILLSIPDIYPTLLGLMQFQNDIPADVSGQNFADYFKTGQGETPESQLYMYISEKVSSEKGLRGVRTKKYTLAYDSYYHFGSDNLYLHNNIVDPFQLINIAEQEPELVDSLTGILKKWLKKTNDPFMLF